MKVILKRVLFLLAVIGIWQLVYSLGIYEKIVFPGPLQVGDALITGFTTGDFLTALGASFRHLFSGLSLAILFGTILGVILGKSKQADETAGMYLIALQSIPSIVWVPLAIMLFGFSEFAVVFVVVLGGTFVMALNVRSAIHSVPPQLVRAARTMGTNGLSLFFRVEIPSSVPYFMSGLRLAWAFSWRALMAGELLSNGPGLGYSLRYAQDYARMDQVIGIIIIIGVIGAVVDQLVFSKLEKNVMKRWGLLKT
ncbi:ABC transporter permease [Halobacillus halophilus]|uniref:ABC-type transport system permease protein (Probable substrate sulfonate/nitrate/taurine) n=1 Tax=Halobacillus halophilus (strain ATCC 35676 / DSM 2266 / JCM 20832 / KCTC 3685 / LMG 17431 / NBRC 102448 / NCIMB 2269) TaxID=866895 RepID=I0JJR9_HALH3|nr:ABC transporter permease [Halobacillus halophilus]ASF38540.1 ABC transporter permease [Halobacillus halophilus]CCG44388.1 ABC-type transport system permease protein (probable substrate sulfonate/nitrate/taurine) [Halobacillus halophilus DSM 2266]